MADDGAGQDSEREDRIRERAYRLWQEEGRPEGRAEAHWDKASELVAIEDNYKSTLKPNPTEQYENSPTGEPVEPLEAVRNLGEFPTLTDQGEEAVFPDRSLAADAYSPPLRPGRNSASRPARKR